MKFVMGFLSGFAVGAAVALLLAPEAGAELRAGMSATAHEDWDAASTQLHKAMENVQQQLGSMQEQLNAMRAQGAAEEVVDAEETQVAQA